MIEVIKSYFCLNKKFLVYNLVDRNMKVKYRRSLLGVFWTILGPISLALVYFLVFKVILKVDKPNYLLLVVGGVMAWNLFAQTVGEALSHYVDRQGLITKIYFPIQAFNITTTMTNAITLISSVPILIGIAFWDGVQPSYHLLLMPYYLTCLGLFTYACSIVVAWLYVFFRDLRQIIGIILQLLFYGTPVLYTLDMVPEKFRWIFVYNPLATMISGVQNSVLGQYTHTVLQEIIMLTWVVVMSIIAAYLVVKKRTPVVENL
jgi:ABC-type polysaccharide/polyol phosphate export permease